VIIGVSGYARSGKDTIASHLVKSYGFTQLSFADILRKGVYELNSIVGYNRVDLGDGEFALETVRTQQVIDEFGWDSYKEKSEFATEIRLQLQHLGTEVGRNLLGEDVWVQAAFRLLNADENYVIPDCRFENEARTVVEFGGQVFRVSRPGVEPFNAHPSEVGLDGWDFDAYFNNEGSIEDLHSLVDAYMMSMVVES
jgi:hypothetical protein